MRFERRFPMFDKRFLSRFPVLLLLIGLLALGCGGGDKGTTMTNGDDGGTMITDTTDDMDSTTITEDIEIEDPVDIPPQRPEDPSVIFWEQAPEGEVQRVHFDYDKSEITADIELILKANAEWMIANPGYFVWVEGHCDSRGSSEYNIALGERRALGVRNFLIGEDVDEARLYTISYGEEKPIAFGENEEAWAENRRTEFKVGLPPQ